MVPEQECVTLVLFAAMKSRWPHDRLHRNTFSQRLCAHFPQRGGGHGLGGRFPSRRRSDRHTGRAEAAFVPLAFMRDGASCERPLPKESQT